MEGSPIDALRERRLEGVCAGTLDDRDERRRIPEDLTLSQFRINHVLLSFFQLTAETFWKALQAAAQLLMDGHAAEQS